MEEEDTNQIITEVHLSGDSGSEEEGRAVYPRKRHSRGVQGKDGEMETSD